MSLDDEILNRGLSDMVQLAEVDSVARRHLGSTPPPSHRGHQRMTLSGERQGFRCGYLERPAPGRPG
jgi:hypothetical protein